MIILNIIAVLLLLAGYMIPVYKYEWSLDPDLASVVNSDAILAVIVLLVLSLASATIALFLKQKPKCTYYLFYVVVITLNIYRLLKIVPIYCG